VRASAVVVFALLAAGCLAKPAREPDCVAMTASVHIPGLYGRLNETSPPGWTRHNTTNTWVWFDGASNWTLLVGPADSSRLVWLDLESKENHEVIEFLNQTLQGMGLPGHVDHDGGILGGYVRQGTCIAPNSWGA
jgi:hypothetical protein